MPSPVTAPTPAAPPAGYMKTIKDVIAGTCGEERPRRGLERQCKSKKTPGKPRTKKEKLTPLVSPLTPSRSFRPLFRLQNSPQAASPSRSSGTPSTPSKSASRRSPPSTPFTVRSTDSFFLVERSKIGAGRLFSLMKKQQQEKTHPFFSTSLKKKKRTTTQPASSTACARPWPGRAWGGSTRA